MDGQVAKFVLLCSVTYAMFESGTMCLSLLSKPVV